MPSWPNSLLTLTGQDKPKSWQFTWKWMSVLSLQSIQELLSYSSTGMGRGRKGGKRRAGSIHHLAWPCYLHPLTKALGRALQQAQLSIDELTLAELSFMVFHIHDSRDHHPHELNAIKFSCVCGQSPWGDILDCHRVWLYSSLCAIWQLG